MYPKSLTKVAARWALSDKSADHCMVVDLKRIKISTATVSEKITRIDQEQQVLLVTLHDNPGDDIFIGMFEDIGRFQVNNMREFRNDFTVSKFGLLLMQWSFQRSGIHVYLRPGFSRLGDAIILYLLIAEDIEIDDSNSVFLIPTLALPPFIHLLLSPFFTLLGG